MQKMLGVNHLASTISPDQRKIWYVAIELDNYSILMIFLSRGWRGSKYFAEICSFLTLFCKLPHVNTKGCP